MTYKFLIGILFCSLIFVNTSKAEKRMVNLLHQDYFGFEAANNGWYFWGTNDYWNVVSEKASDGNFSMRFSYPDLSSVTSSVKAQAGSASNEGSLFKVPAGKHEMTMKIWVEEGSKISSFVFVVKDPWTTFTWQIDTVTPGKWVTLSKEITFSQDISSTWQLVVEGSETGGGTFYIDELSIMGEVEFPDLIPNSSSVKTIATQGIDLKEGNYTMRMKVKKDEGTTINGFHVSFGENNSALYWDLSAVSPGNWIQLEQRFHVQNTITNVGMEIVVPNVSVMGGGKGTFYVDDLEIELYSATQVSELEDANVNVLMYPNPTEGPVNFECGDEVKLILVRNMAGCILLKKQVENRNYKLDMAGFSKGIYLVTVFLNNGSTHTKKLIVK